MASASFEPPAGSREQEQSLAALEDTQEPDVADEEVTAELPQVQAQETKAWGRLGKCILLKLMFVNAFQDIVPLIRPKLLQLCFKWLHET